MSELSRSKLFYHVIIGSIILSIPFLINNLGFVILFALVPLLCLENELVNRQIKGGWKYYYGLFVLWNLFTTFWIYKATIPGAVGAVLLNAMQMAIIFASFIYFKKKFGKLIGYLFLIIAWVAWEHFYFDAEISWPWLVLGNAFASSYKLVQWYEFTGVIGGSLWILLVNIILFEIIKIEERSNRKYLILALSILLVIPISLSIYRYSTYKENGKEYNVVALQPNIDPYNDKFGGMSQFEQTNRLLELANESIHNLDKTKPLLMVAPETFSSNFEENTPLANETARTVSHFLKSNPNISLIYGAVSYYIYPTETKPTFTARKFQYGWYDVFNSAMLTDSSDLYQFYHKSKLVVLVEFLPYPQYLPFLSKFFIDLGGATGSYATQNDVTLFTTSDSLKVGSAICYESVYGNYYRKWVKKGADLMTVITNDGWWGDTPGYKQHLRYASLRAIETRRSIVRSANTGISALINQRGDIIKSSKWWEPAYISGQLKLNDHITPFTTIGDILGRIALWILPIFLFLPIWERLKRVKREKI